MKLLSVLLLTILLAGCGSAGAGGALSSLFGSGGSSSVGSSIAAGSGVTGSSGVILSHTPEPSTVALLGIGLLALAAAKLRNRKKR